MLGYSQPCLSGNTTAAAEAGEAPRKKQALPPAKRRKPIRAPPCLVDESDEE